MGEFLEALSHHYEDFADEPANSFAFTLGAAQLVRFTPLTGLNDASFICERRNVVPIKHEGGAIAIPDRLVDSVSAECKLPGGTLPYYALVTGNTEQRYLRVLFMRDDDHMFQLAMTNRLTEFESGGVGVLNQVLEALPPEVNLIRIANYIIEKTPSVEAGRIELIGHWRSPDDTSGLQPGQMERALRSRLEKLRVTDANGVEHSAALQDFEFASPRAVNPPVFVSYSTKYDVAKLNYLLGALSANQFEPVLGTDPGATLAGGIDRPPQLVSANVTDTSFRLIPECVAFVSLQVKRDDYKVANDRYVLPPWAIAEETFAWSRGVPLLLRLKDAAIDSTSYDRNILAKEFSSDAEYPKAVDEIIYELNNFRRGRQFSRVWERIREQAFRAHRTSLKSPRRSAGSGQSG